jgi:hypothetical protein
MFDAMGIPAAGLTPPGGAPPKPGSGHSSNIQPASPPSSVDDRLVLIVHLHKRRTHHPARIGAQNQQIWSQHEILEADSAKDIVLRFIANNFDAGTAVLATDDRFGKFMSLARDHKDALAAQEYKRLTDASLAECHLATTYARGLA